MTATPKADVELRRERLRGLVALGAQRAAGALTEFAGATVQAGGLRGGEALKSPPFETGVIFAVAGRLGGHLAFCLDTLSRRALVRLLLDEDEPEAPPDMVASALGELGNIVASQAVSAIADAVGGSIALSVPDLALEGVVARLQSLRGGRGEGDLTVSCELSAPESELRVLLVVAIDA
jgi:chemotaxis protein CheY-P-specific phosphatase CheC